MPSEFALRHVLCAVLLAVTGCPGNLQDPERFRQGSGIDDPSGCGDVEIEIFKPRCAQSGCHASRSPAAGLDLLSPGIAERVVGVASRTCADRLLVDPNDPSRDFFMEKLDPLPECGNRMPLIGKPLSADEVTCVRAWVKENTGKGDDVDAAPPAPDAAREVDAGAAPDASSPPPYNGSYGP